MSLPLAHAKIDDERSRERNCQSMHPVFFSFREGPGSRGCFGAVKTYVFEHVQINVIV